MVGPSCQPISQEGLCRACGLQVWTTLLGQELPLKTRIRLRVRVNTIKLGFGHCLLHNVTNLHPQFFIYSVYQI